ncbi:MAG: aldolase/citrate lyase family protein, partial [Bryobacteraceae bacterium]
MTQARRFLDWSASTTISILFLLPASLWAQQPPVHFNPVIEKLAQGKVVVGTGTGDLSLDNAHAIARSDLDFVRLEMEHGPLDVEKIYIFLNEMVDRASMRKHSGQISVAPIARFPPYGRESSQWVAKQGLDAGLMGVAFNGVDNKEQALLAVRSMRYPQRRGSPHMEPLGLRGFGPMNALWFWGVDAEEYRQHADVWPLNPQGDMLAIIMIETTEGLAKVDEIASVPGVGVIWPGAGVDLSYSMGIPADSPELEGAFQKILKACLDHHVACGINPQPADIPKRIQEGWKYLEIGGGGLPAGTDAALKIVRANT